MVLIRRLKNLVKSIARRLPLVRAIIRRSTLVRAVLARSGLVSRQRLETLAADALSVVPVRGLPHSVTFRGPNARHMVFFLGVTQMNAAVQGLTVDVVVRDRKDHELQRLRERELAPEAAAPAMLRQRAPEGLAWYSLAVDAGPDDWKSLQLRFHPGAGPAGSRGDLRCFCVLVGREEVGGRPRWIVDLAEGNPVTVQAAGS